MSKVFSFCASFLSSLLCRRAEFFRELNVFFRCWSKSQGGRVTDLWHLPHIGRLVIKKFRKYWGAAAPQLPLWLYPCLINWLPDFLHYSIVIWDYWLSLDVLAVLHEKVSVPQLWSATYFHLCQTEDPVAVNHTKHIYRVMYVTVWRDRYNKCSAPFKFIFQDSK